MSDDINIVTATFYPDNQCRASALWQWDRGQVLQIHGLEQPEVYEIHFSNVPDRGTAERHIATADGVEVPYKYVTSGENVYAWIYIATSEDVAKTERMITIPVQKRPQPAPADPTPAETDIINEAIATLNTGIEEMEQVTALVENPSAHAETLPAGSEATASYRDGEFTFGIPQGINGYSPTASVSKSGNITTITVTDAHGTTEAELRDGEPGISPTIATTYVPGGHELTIIDVDHPNGQTVDVMDGRSAYVWIRYSATEPTSNSDMKTTPDAWIGICSGEMEFAPPVYTAYTWYKIKGENGGVQDIKIGGTSIVSNSMANIEVARGLTIGTGSNRPIVADIADQTRIRTQSQDRLISPAVQHMSVFYGLAYAAGDLTQASETTLTYTEDARSKIYEMLNMPTYIYGSTPVIAAKAGVRYICGEVSTLEQTLPGRGRVDITFDSGSTPTVLTVPDTVKWADGFNATNLDANTSYELDILDGKFGVARSWA